MDSLFSHAPQSEGEAAAAGEAPPSRVCRLSIPAPRDLVYNAFVDDIHLWWPAAYTGFGDGTHVFIEDGLVGEEGDDGQLQTWGEVTSEEPGRFLEMAWTLGWRADAPTRVRVEFSDGPGVTLVVLTHDGWARGAEGAEQFAKYNEWPRIVGRFAAFFGQPAPSAEEG
ncbi:hypothetical protein GCM10027449_03700 [Sinomonas notoginsengisoli]